MMMYKGYKVLSVRYYSPKGRVRLPEFKSPDGFYISDLYDEALKGNCFMATRRQTFFNDNGKEMVRESLLFKQKSF